MRQKEEVNDVVGNGKWQVPLWEVFKVNFNGTSNN